MLTYPINLTNGPGPLAAFLPDPDPALIAATAVALANTDGGALVIGLDSRAVYTGPVDGSAVVRALRDAEALCNPSLTLDRYELVATPHGPVIAVRVARSGRVHALPDGRVMVRAGQSNRALSGEEVRALISHKSTGDFEAAVVPGARPGDLDPARLGDLLARCGNGCTDDDLLIELDAVTPEANVTVAGMLLFGRDPQRWLPHSGARFVRYLTDGHVAFERAVNGPLVQIVDDLHDMIAAQQRTPVDSPGGADYPEDVVREALVNAVSHRDYRRRRENVRVCLYPDRLEITSPGGLPAFLTTPHLLDGRYSRNPRLNWGLFQWGYGAEPGQGVLRMIMGMDGHGAQPPEIDAGRDSVTVRLYRVTGANGVGISPEIALNERQYVALEYVRARGSITLHEFRTLCPAVQSSVLQRDLRDMLAADLLLKVGPRSGAYYILP